MKDGIAWEALFKDKKVNIFSASSVQLLHLHPRGQKKLVMQTLAQDRAFIVCVPFEARRSRFSVISFPFHCPSHITGKIILEK
ncbi:hypothetical protein B14911_24591 [Bacillus sp. NRRL B-14911]|uniref:Uncharacterized protein n=1 Tax=Bacillus infantis NRRL B-14911 TaxID=1367477 RepID=U5LHA8_9BACI|nr:hypothetical protein N288_20705 [Bacillus infantis NRRL B-14911]EAR64141.1 hypothetical protein B14911_24591 [Bacillus sp. NRRL B-14911]